MRNYKTQTDDKLHTHYSGLKRCTSLKPTLRLVREMAGELENFSGPVVDFGKTRHEVWAEQSKRTGRTPSEFAHLYDQPVDFIEHAFAVEVFKNVVLHFRPDAVSLADEAVIDYKKTVGGARQFLTSMQLIIYAYGLQLHGHRITKRVYLCEIWDKDTTKIIGYQKLVQPISLADMGMAPKWIKERAARLIAINDQYQKERVNV